MDRITSVIVLVLIFILIIIVSIQLYHKFSYLFIFILLLSFLFEILWGYFHSIKQLYKNFPQDKIQILKTRCDKGENKILNFNYSLNIDNLNLYTAVWKVFMFLCIPTLLTEILIFLPLLIIFKILPFLEYLRIIWNILSFLLLLQLCFWVHEFAHIIVAHLSKGVEYVVKTPIKYKFLEICLAGGILTKYEFRFESIWKKLCCAISGPFANLILALILLMLYFYTNITIFYIGFIMNVIILYIHLLPVTLGEISFDGESFVHELALFKMKKIDLYKNV